MKEWFSRQKLNVKFTVVIGLLMLIPVVMIYFILFGNLQSNMMKQERDAEEESLLQTYSEIQKTVDLCNMSTQVFLNNQNLNSFLVRLKKGEEIPTTELVDFYQNDIAMLERLVNSNPYLYRIRVYARSNDFSEMMPILFGEKRLEALPWANSYVSGQWQLNYSDTALGVSTGRPAEHIMSLVTSIEEFGEGEIGVLEVAVDMSRIFPQLFTEDESRQACFLDQSGVLYTGQEEWWKKNRDEVLDTLSVQDQDTAGYMEMKIGGEQVILGCMPVKELSGSLIQVVHVGEKLRAIDRQRGLYLAVVIVVYLVLLLLINGIVNTLLRKFRGIMDMIRQVQDGDLDVRAPEQGKDEISELGIQINKMLERIQILIDENVNRELLMKNSEIRALQNQINAHFIYNVLESIKMMAEIQEEYDISDAVTSLGRLLRYSMKWTSQDVTVRQEIDYIRDYLDLINLRFDYEINLNLKISDRVYSQKIPKMSLQPIVENAIYHGIEEMAEDASIYIKAIECDTYFILEITDSGQGMTPEQVRNLEKKIAGEIEVSGGSGNGIGLKNVQDRIRISYGEPYGIGVVSKEGCFTKITVTIPMKDNGGVNTNEKSVDSGR